MVIQKNSNEREIECFYDSSNVLASKYVKESKKLAVIYKSGDQYVYHDIPLTLYTQFESAKSQGSFIHSNIKGYKSEKAGKIDTSMIVEQINNLKNNND